MKAEIKDDEVKLVKKLLKMILKTDVEDQQAVDFTFEVGKNRLYEIASQTREK